MNRTVTTAIFVSALKSLTGIPGVPDGFNVQLMPWGQFSAMDGRPADVGLKAWTLDAASGAAIVDRFNARQTPLVIDYEHQTVFAETNGQPAPAAGWIEKLAAVVGVGLVARVKWTDRAAAAIHANEYKFVSPVFGFDPKTGAVRFLKHAGLVNDPGLSAQAQSVALKSAQLGTHDFNDSPTEEENSMSDVLVSLRAALGIDASVTAESAIQAVVSLKAQADSHATTIATLKGSQFDAAKHVPMDTHKAVADELVALKASAAHAEVAALVEAALSANPPKLVPAQKEWALSLGVDGLTAFLKSAPALGLGTTQSGGKGSEGAALSDQEVALKARQHQDAQAQSGVHISITEAVAFVNGTQKKG